MKSGVVKQKWTADEEAALRAGVEKYGAGKWRAIQKDANFGACLISRSNVDLKDKWRNMSVSANGLGSRDRATRISASKMKQGEVMSAKGQLGAEASMIDSFCASGVADGEEVVGARFDNLVLEAILKLQGTNGGSKGQIASYLEKHYPVPYHFRRLLAAKLKALTQQGKLIKIRRHYSMTQDGEQEEYHGLGLKTAAQSDCETSEDADIVYKLKNMSANEVAMMAAQAVADAEVAAAAAEEAARVAEIAEAEWEAAESAAHMAAALAMRRSRRF